MLELDHGVQGKAFDPGTPGVEVAASEALKPLRTVGSGLSIPGTIEASPHPGGRLIRIERLFVLCMPWPPGMASASAQTPPDIAGTWQLDSLRVEAMADELSDTARAGACPHDGAFMVAVDADRLVLGLHLQGAATGLLEIFWLSRAPDS